MKQSGFGFVMEIGILAIGCVGIGYGLKCRKQLNELSELFKGETGSKTRRRSGDYVSYRDYSNRDRDRRESPLRGRFDLDDLVFDYRRDAEATLEQMDDMIERYGWATVLDLYESADLGASAPWTANKYGWTSLRSAEVVKARDGYVIKLPKAMPLD